MTRDNIIGLILIVGILIGFSILTAPTEEERMEAQRVRDSIALAQQAEEERRRALEEAVDPMEAEPLPDEIAVEDPATADPEVVERIRDRMGLFSEAALGEEGFITLENEVLKLKISRKGGNIHSATLKKYQTFEGDPLQLFKGEEDRFTFHFFAGNRNISTETLFFEPHYKDPRFTGQDSIAIEAVDSTAFSMRAYTDNHTPENPSYIEYFYGLTGDEYMIDFHVNFVGTADVIALNTTYLTLDWEIKMPRQEKNREHEQGNSTVFYKYENDDVSKLRERRDASDRLLTTIRWISFKQQFFSSVLISEEGFSNADIASEFINETEEDYLKNMSASIDFPYNAREDNFYPMQFYLGPNQYREMQAYNLELERQIPLGWGFFLTSWINRFAVIPVFNFLDQFDLNYGIIILLLTVILKIVLIPIAYKTYISQAKMRVLKPDIEELGKKFPKKEDAMKKQQATMALYKKAGVNPMSGCVPMLLQLPILISLFRFFPASIELRQEAFLWADDLSTYDSILDLPFTIPFYGDHVSLFTILMTISTIFYTRFNSQMMGSSSQMPGMKTMMYFMPVMLMGIFNNFASGLSYYYFLANVITFGQMFLFRIFVDEDALHRKIEENKKKPVKKSKWQARMESLAKQQEQQKKMKSKKK